MSKTDQEPHVKAATEATGAGPGEPSNPSVAPVRINPSDFSISLAAKGGAEALLAADQGTVLQELPGFESTYVDIVDYIVRITHRIWEEKDIGYIYDTYRHNARVTDDVGMQIGRDKIVADTIHTVNAFPDIRLFADEVIWASDTAAAFHTSHRVSKVAHNIGHSRWGPPTGRKVVLWVIANCVARENEIFEEWVLYNTGSLLSQLGFDLRVLARQLADQDPLPALDDPPTGELERLRGQGAPRHLTPSQADGFDVEDFVRRTYHYTWNWRNLSTIDRAYAARVSYHGGTGRELYGRGQLKSFVLSLMAMFPDLVMHVDDVYWMGNDQDGYSVAVRWTAIGTHRGHGIYGPPSGRQAKLWGLSQHHIIGGQIIEEWTVFNEFELLKQLLRDGPVATC
jgi:predicted ester cyclase